MPSSRAVGVGNRPEVGDVEVEPSRMRGSPENRTPFRHHRRQVFGIDRVLCVDLQVDGLVPAKKKTTHWFPNSDATKRKPDFRIHRLDATGTVSKYLIFSALTSSSSCSIVTLYKSPSSLCSRKKKAPLCGRLSKILDKGRPHSPSFYASPLQ
jgi:hypothetical protein